MKKILIFGAGMVSTVLLLELLKTKTKKIKKTKEEIYIEEQIETITEILKDLRNQKIENIRQGKMVWKIESKISKFEKQKDELRHRLMNMNHKEPKYTDEEVDNMVKLFRDLKLDRKAAKFLLKR